MLLEYPSIVTIATDAAIKSIRDRVGPQGTTADVQPVQSAIAKLKAQNGELGAVLRANQGTASEITNELNAVIVNPPQYRANFVQETQEAAMDSQRITMAAVEDLLRRSDGIDMSVMFEMILGIRKNIATPARARRTPWPRVLPNTTTYTPTILDNILKLQVPSIDYVRSDPDTLAKYVGEQRLRRPAEFMDEQDIWDIFRDIIVQVDQKCAAGNWSGEFSEGIPSLLVGIIEEMIVYEVSEGQDFKNPRTRPLLNLAHFVGH